MQNIIIIIIASIIFFIMFIYSGYDKINNFNDKIKSLDSKLSQYIKFSEPILKFAMILVILLELVGPIIILSRMILGKNAPKILKLLSNIIASIWVMLHFICLQSSHTHIPSIPPIKRMLKKIPLILVR